MDRKVFLIPSNGVAVAVVKLTTVFVREAVALPSLLRWRFGAGEDSLAIDICSVWMLIVLTSSAGMLLLDSAAAAAAATAAGSGAKARASLLVLGWFVEVASGGGKKYESSGFILRALMYAEAAARGAWTSGVRFSLW